MPKPLNITYNKVTFLITLNMAFLSLILAAIFICYEQVILAMMLLMNIYTSYIIIRITKELDKKEKEKNE